MKLVIACFIIFLIFFVMGCTFVSSPLHIGGTIANKTVDIDIGLGGNVTRSKDSGSAKK